jgi:hypothetical protein
MHAVFSPAENLVKGYALGYWEDGLIVAAFNMQP